MRPSARARLPSVPAPRSWMYQDALVGAFASRLGAGHQLMDLAVELRAREQPAFDGATELALEHVVFPAVDDDLVHFRPAGRIELAPRERDKGAARLEPGVAAHDLARGGAAAHDVGAAHDFFDRILRHHRDAELLRPVVRESAAGLRPA